jgi:hypothetical protein
VAKASPTQRKPYPDFPLTAHRNGQWCKKIRGKLHYFGTDADAALAKYLNERDDLQAGRQPRTTTGTTQAEMVNTYLGACDECREAGTIAAVTFSDYRVTGKVVVSHFGRTIDPTQIRPTEFARFRNALAVKYAPSRVGKMVTMTRMMFKWAFESEVIVSMPNFGPDFKSTSKRQARVAKARQGQKLFPADGIRRLLCDMASAARLNGLTH